MSGDSANHPHIVYVVDHFPTLSQTFIENQMLSLVELGFHLTVLSFGRGSATALHETTRKLLPRIDLRYVELPETLGRKAIAAKLWRARHRWAGLASLMRPLGSYRWRAVVNAAASLETLQADAILAHFGPNGIYAAALRELGLLSGPITTFFHGYDFSSFVRKHGVGVYQRLFSACDRFIANSRFSKGRLVAMGCPEDKLSVIPVGLLPESFSVPSIRRSWDGGAIRFLTVARLVEKKGHAFAIDALALVVGQDVQATLTIVGDGPERQKLTVQAQSLGLGSRVVFAGPQPQSEVRAMMGTHDIFLLASIEASDGDVEGQGLVLQEAQACGMPVIATRHNGFPESIREGVTGLLVPERDVQALALAMSGLAADAALRATMAEVGPGFVAENFDQRQLTRRLVNLLALS